MTKDTNFTNEFHLYSQLPVNSNLLGKSKEVQVIGSSKQITSNKEQVSCKWHGCFAMNSIFRTSEHCWSICFCLWLCSYILCNFLRVIEYYEQLLRVFFQVADSLDLDPIPSAYQIRFKGCKGMLAIDPSLPNGDVKEILLYRKSMDKFSSTHPALEICEATKPSEMDKFCCCYSILIF